MRGVTALRHRSCGGARAAAQEFVRARLFGEAYWKAVAAKVQHAGRALAQWPHAWRAG